MGDHLERDACCTTFDSFWGVRLVYVYAMIIVCGLCFSLSKPGSRVFQGILALSLMKTYSCLKGLTE